MWVNLAIAYVARAGLTASYPHALYAAVGYACAEPYDPSNKLMYNDIRMVNSGGYPPESA